MFWLVTVRLNRFWLVENKLESRKGQLDSCKWEISRSSTSNNLVWIAYELQRPMKNSRIIIIFLILESMQCSMFSINPIRLLHLQAIIISCDGPFKKPEVDSWLFSNTVNLHQECCLSLAFVQTIAGSLWDKKSSKFPPPLMVGSCHPLQPSDPIFGLTVVMNL